MRRERSKSHEASRAPRRSRRIHEESHDPFGAREKLPDPTVCSRCGALFRRGRWMWADAPADAHRTLCPACRRIQEGYPAGVVSVEGGFAAAHREEIRGLVQNVAERERAEHPLKRILAIREEGEDLRVETTDGKLAEAIGRALEDAYAGDLRQAPVDAGDLLRVRWRRD